MGLTESQLKAAGIDFVKEIVDPQDFLKENTQANILTNYLLDFTNIISRENWVGNRLDHILLAHLLTALSLLERSTEIG